MNTLTTCLLCAGVLISYLSFLAGRGYEINKRDKQLKYR